MIRRPIMLSQEQVMVRDSARDFLQAKAPVSAQRALRDGRDPLGYSVSLWQDMAAAGWAGMFVPERHGGAGLGHVEAGLIFEEMGRVLAAAPLLPTAVLGVRMLMLGGSEAQRESLLPEIAAGRKIVALAVDEEPKHAPRRITLSATSVGEGYKLDGEKLLVLDGHSADLLLIAARTAPATTQPGGVSVFAVPRGADGVTIDRIVLLDSRCAARVRLRNVVVPKDSLLGPWGGGDQMLAQVLDSGRACLAAELVGIARSALERTTTYLAERRQFGRRVASFQALQHRLALAHCEIELAAAAVLRALISIDELSDAVACDVAVAKAKAGQAARLTVNEALQMHGGMGMTDECDIGLFLKRCRVANEIFGDPEFHAETVARHVGF